LAIVLAIFLFGAGPVWERAFDIDLSVYYSYVPIPALVLGCLFWGRKLTLRGFLLDTLELTLVKFGVTYSVAIVLWASMPVPPPLPHAQRIPWLAPAPPPSPPDPTPIPAGQRGVLSGVVIDAAQQPVGGAVVFVAGGLEGFVFSAPRQPLQLVNDGSGLSPRFSIAQVYQPIEARSGDRRLHNVVATSGGETAIFNVPLLPSGTPNTIVLREPHPRSRLRCTVHEHASNEAAAELMVLSHPFFATTARDGIFRFEGVPAGSLRVTAVAHSGAEASGDVSLQGGGEARLRLVVR
jgi:hypothetical protein